MGQMLREALARQITPKDVQEELNRRTYRETKRVKGRLRRKGAPHKGKERSVAILRGRPKEEIPKRRVE